MKITKRTSKFTPFKCFLRCNYSLLLSWHVIAAKNTRDSSLLFILLTQHDNISDALASARRIRQHQLVLSTVGSGCLPDCQHGVPLVFVDGDAVTVVLDLLWGEVVWDKEWGSCVLLFLTIIRNDAYLFLFSFEMEAMGQAPTSRNTAFLPKQNNHNPVLLLRL